jgi:septum site-determining protein MinD
MTRIIVCASGKGGVGKTTLVANLGIALAEMKKDVTVVDANLTTPNLGLHLGIPLYPRTLHDVVKGRANIRDVIYQHESGLKIIPAGISLRDLKGADPKELPNAFLGLLGTTDIVLVDASAGLGREALSALEAADELLLITTPDVSSVTDALKTAKLAEQVGTRVLGAVINRRAGRHQMTREDVASMLSNVPILAEVPEDVDIQKATHRRTPVLHHRPRARSSQEIRNLARRLSGLPPEERRSFLDFLLRR